ncbi:MAG TPA: hypothetical protein VMP01_11260 [Pirellulaceae bacterium]|nr:hypothetical protein [Pirellulaceae bacterium]
MKYAVDWVPSAAIELARLYEQSQDKNEFAQHVNGIENALARRPLLIGESRGGNLRILVDLSIVIEYLVSSNDKLVVVTAVWLYPKKP